MDGNVSHNSWIRIGSVNIPRGAIIDSAVLTLKASSSNSGSSCNVNIFSEVGGNNAAPTSYLDAEGKTLSEPVQWNDIETFSFGTSYNSADISDLLQEVVNLESWVPGDGVLLLIKDNGTSLNIMRYFSAFNSSTNANNPSLAVSWTVRVGYCTIPPATTEGFCGSSGVMSVAAPAVLGADALLRTRADGFMSLRINNDGLGGMAVSGYVGARGAATVPVLAVAGVAKRGADGAVALPLGIAAGRAGCRGSASFALLSLVGRTTNPSHGACTISAFAAYAFVYTGMLAQGYCTLSKLSCSSLAFNGRIGDGTACISLKIAGAAFAGKLAAGFPAMRGMTATGQASPTSEGGSAVRLWPMTLVARATADSSEFSSPLYYDKDAMQ